MKFIAIGLIRIYQWTIAPMLGATCRFTPSCSHYAIEAFQTHGFFRGFWLTLKRLLRCNPLCDCGHDPVPPSLKDD